MEKITTKKFTPNLKEKTVAIKNYACPLNKKEMNTFIELIEKVSEQARSWKIDLWYWTIDMKFKCKSSEVE